MDPQLRTADLTVLVIYMAGVFGLGCWFSRKSGKTEEFMAAGRSLPGWAVGLSIFGTYVSSIGFLANAGKAYGGTWNSWVFGLSLPIAAVIAVRWFVPLYRGGNEISAYYHLEKRFGPWARTYALICYLLTQFARVGALLYLVALALGPLTGWDIKTIILVTGVLVTVYTLLGGIEAVIWTDVVQSIVLMAGAVFCAVLLLTEMPEGPGQLFEIAKENDKFSLGSFSLKPESFTFANPTFWIVLVYGIFINIQNFGIDQSFVQRYATAKTDRDAKFSVWLGALLFLPISALFFFIGTGLFSLYQTDPVLLNDLRLETARQELIQDGQKPTEATIAATAERLREERLNAVRKELSENGQEPTEAAIAAAVEKREGEDIGDKVLPHFIGNKLPRGLAGLLIAAIFAAAMSSMDTSLNSSASLYLCDIHKRYIRPQAGEKESMRVLHVATLIFGVIGTVTALAMIRVKSVLDMWWDLQGIFTGGMLGLFLLGMISKRARNPQAIAAVIFGIFLILWLALTRMKFWPEEWVSWANPLHGFLTIVVGTTSIVLVGVLASALAKPRE